MLFPLPCQSSIHDRLRTVPSQLGKHEQYQASGEMAEWLKAPDSKSGIPETVSGVRIPLSPIFNGASRSEAH